MKIVSVIGARPQFVKAAAVSRVLRKHSNLHEILVHTGQHFDANMSDIFFSELDIPKPDYNLGVGGGTHGENTGRMIENIEKVLLREKPEWVMVYGDTDSTLAAAIAAKKLHISLAHVEAGLRSFNMRMPEEINRILTDRISDVLFCPTQTAVDNLSKEGFAGFNAEILQVGDVMFDATLHYKEQSKKPNNLEGVLLDSFCLCTIHRADNTGVAENIENIFKALQKISKEHTVILPIHPRTAKMLHSFGQNFSDERIKIIEPVGYLEMIWLLERCEFVMTDSGGLQKEAYFFNKPCITLRNETEWIELINEGANKLGGSNYERIMDIYHKLQYFSCGSKNLYGNGDASKRISEFFINKIEK